MRVLLATLSVCLLSLTAAAQQAPCPTPSSPLSSGAISQGTLVARLRQQANATGCPDTAPRTFSLKHTEVDAEVSGFLASVTVTQVFENPYTEPLEALYVFPLPEKAAVDGMELVIGERIIKGVIQTKDQARATYEKAKAEGKTAALLDQERPNIFTQSVANILPGEQIRVRIHYVDRLPYEAGTYRFTFPMVVGPRYIGGEALPTRQGEGTAPDTTTVPDASRISPPVLPPETRSGHDIQLTVRLDAGLPVQALRSTSHRVEVSRDGRSRAHVQLGQDARIPNKDFTLEYTVADALIRPAVLVHREPGADHGYFLVLLNPQLQPTDKEVVPREVYFVLDTSGSQSGLPIEKSKAITAEVLRHLNPEDSFQVLDFNTVVKKFSEKAVPATPENVARALPYVANFWGGGGTDINAATQEAIIPPNDPARLRMVLFMTDGYIGGEDEVLATLQDHLGEETRVFTAGVGGSTNRYLVAKMAEVGRGSSTFVNLQRPEDEVASEFETRIRGPVLTSLRAELDGMPVNSVYPKVLPDLFAGQPLFMVGRFHGTGDGVLRITGRVRGVERRFEVPVHFPEVAPENSALRSLWARQRIEELTVQGYRGETPEVVEGITSTALTYGLMSKYTSFVAVEQVARTEPNGPSVKEVVPVHLPEGVSYAGVFGELSREEIPPGDPIISVRAPKDARRVTAYFPFGLVKPLTFDPVTGAWRGRFLVPLSVKDGYYEVVIAAELPDGQVLRREVRYRLDSKGNEFDVTLSSAEVAAGGMLKLDVDAVEATKEVSVYSELFGEEQHQLETKDGLRFTGELTVPRDAVPGEYELVFVARDSAGNRFERREKVRVNTWVLQLQ
ncbi:VWA domain-containing protein [Pyxidicoccus parkwayensis]|uniref:VWA domain-containing protein n=1 Tax=Pyxidicoccus parkwayensis TaxID=2813578 RepID=A0ABX7P896_9BACT|nr:VIT domain-containing protein [Pyxidicoccus parkwaysis]QSQ26672.1 VWA domain-containing protein [Pyxidicoccus parkwaysis]